MINTIFHQLRLISLTWWIAIGIAAAILFAVHHKNKHQLLGNILLVYLAIVFASTVLSRTPVRHDALSDLVNFDLLGTWASRFAGNDSGRAELLLNFFMLMPVGFLLPLSFSKRFWETIFIGFLVTLAIESLQLTTGRGWFELSDIVDNTIGVAIGYGCYSIGKALRRGFVHDK